jgi:hypothetical protein
VYQYCSTSIAAGFFILSNICRKILVIPVLQILEDSGNTGNTNIADTGRFWKILVIPVLQILEDSGKYW